MSTATFTPGSTVGRYEIVRKIGAGGMAEVYLGRPKDGPVDARVAIKRLAPAFAGERRFVDMFVAEARLAATLHHPNIAKVYEAVLEADLCYFAMEHVHGFDVRALLAAAAARERTMPLPLALAIIYGVTAALAYVHDPRGPHAKLNIVHRDISPSNILVSFDGAIKLVDFGIARVETGAVTRTPSGQIKGKIPYMSPEQCRARALDGRSDLFSLGVVLYELTTGVRPFDRASEYETLEAIVRGEMTRPSKLVSDYPADVEAIVLRLLATRPGDRYPSAGPLLVDLDAVISARHIDLSSELLVAQVGELLGRSLTPIAISATPTVRDVRPRLPASEPPPELAATAREPIDRIAARTSELLELIAPGTSDARDLSADDVAKLFGRAMRSHARGDLETAVLALEIALSAGRPDDGIDALLAANEALFLEVFTAFVGDRGRTIALSQHLEQLIGIQIDQRAAFLLTRIDAALSVNELVATCGLPVREAYRHLCQLLLREILVLV